MKRKSKHRGTRKKKKEDRSGTNDQVTEINFDFSPVMGIDVDKRYLHVRYIVPNPSSQIRASFDQPGGRYTNDELGIQHSIVRSKQLGVTRMALESTSVYHDLALRRYREAGIEVILVNKGLMKKRTRFENKRDPLDARELALGLYRGEIGKDGIYKPSYYPDNEIERNMRRTTRLRDQNSKDLTRVKNRIHKLFNSHGIQPETYLGSKFSETWRLCLSAVTEGLNYDQLLEKAGSNTNVHKRTVHTIKKRANEIRLFLESTRKVIPQSQRIMLSSLLTQWSTIDQTIKLLDNDTDYQVSNLSPDLKRRVQIAKSLPGIGDLLAVRVVAEFGDMSRFANRRKVSRYTGLDVTVHSSGGITHMKGISKAGSRPLRRHLFLAAEHAIRHDRVFRSYHVKMLKKGRKRRQIVCAVARKLAVMYYWHVKNDRLYNKDRGPKKGTYTKTDITKSKTKRNTKNVA